MLCRFSFSNFRSYRSETMLDFRAVAENSEHRESLIDGEFLPVNVIYGQNGGGKSNVLKALMCLMYTVLKPIRETHTILVDDHGPLTVVHCDPFLFDPAAGEEPTEFLLYFRTETTPEDKQRGVYEYCYYLSLLKGEVVSESLERRKPKSRPALLFSRENGSITLGAGLPKKISTSVNAKLPYFSFLCMNTAVPSIQAAQKWFESCLLLDYGIPQINSLLIVPDAADERDQFIRNLNACGIDAADYRIEETQKGTKIYLSHSVNGRSFELDLEDESAGTQKLFSALGPVILALREGRLLVMDELDAKLHPKLLRYVLSLFTSPEINAKGAQLLFTSHDMYTLKSSVFRRDEIWFASVNDQRESELYSLSSIRDENNDRIRTSAAYDKQYMEGRYGADPYFQVFVEDGGWK